MSHARKTLIDRHKAYDIAIKSETIITKSPSETEHNSAARLYRNGLTVVAFAILEDFIKTRTGEILERVGSGLSSFSELPQKLRVAATAGVVRALKHQERFLNEKQIDYFSYHQRHSALVASTQNAGFEISPIAFGFDQTNINSDTVSHILKSFNVKEPWNTIETIAQHVGVGAPALKEAYENAVARRHKAAHQANADIESSDLLDFSPEILGIALGVDLSLSLSLRKLMDRDQSFLNGNLVSSKQVGIRLISPEGKGWRELVVGNKRASFRSRDLDTLLTDCCRRAKVREEAVILQDTRQIPEYWYTPFVD